MKAINDWFRPEDFLRLTLPLEDRRIILRQILVYQDANGQQLFSEDIVGSLLPDIRGESKYPHLTITSFDKGKHSAAEHNNQGYSALANGHTPWHDLCEWLQSLE